VNNFKPTKKTIMKFLNIFLIPAFLFITSAAYTQKVDIDNFRIYINKASLPSNYIPSEKRKYSLNVTGTGNDGTIENNVFIAGWDQVNENPTLEIAINLDPLVMGNSTSRTEKEEKKDKDGKVLSTTTYYIVSSTNSGRGSMKILGPKNEMPRKLSKKQEEKQAKKEQEEKAKRESNPFLKNVDASNTNDETMTDAKSNKQLAYRVSLDHSYTYSSSKNTSSTNATREWQNNSRGQYENHRNQFVKDAIGSANSTLIAAYGYEPYTHWVKFKELDSEKHPEFTMYDNATTALKAIFKDMRYNKPNEEIEQNLKPIIQYFDDVTKKYTKDDKYEKRLRAATMYNLVKIFQYLDRHDKAIEICNQMITLDLEKGDAEDLKEDSEKIKMELAFHNMTSRHIIPKNDRDRQDRLGEKDSEEIKP
jgi:hypothetical protein